MQHILFKLTFLVNLIRISKNANTSLIAGFQKTIWLCGKLAIFNAKSGFYTVTIDSKAKLCICKRKFYLFAGRLKPQTLIAVPIHVISQGVGARHAVPLRVYLT